MSRAGWADFEEGGIEDAVCVFDRSQEGLVFYFLKAPKGEISR